MSKKETPRDQLERHFDEAVGSLKKVEPEFDKKGVTVEVEMIALKQKQEEMLKEYDNALGKGMTIEDKKKMLKDAENFCEKTAVSINKLSQEHLGKPYIR